MRTCQQRPLQKAPRPQPKFFVPIEDSRAWFFNGVHTWTGDDNGSPMSSIDLQTSTGHRWGDDLTRIWVTSAHDGVVTRYSECFLRVTHPSGWFTDYYHLENSQVDTGQVVFGGERLSNYANDRSTALCQGGHSSIPHVHFALGKDNKRIAINSQTYSDYVVHPGRNSYDRSNAHMWLEKDGRKHYVWQHTIRRDKAVNPIDHHVNGMWYQPDFSGHGFNLATQWKSDASGINVFVTFFTYDDQGDANFYSGIASVERLDFEQPITVPMSQAANGGFSAMGAVDRENGEDFIPAGDLTITLEDCSNGYVEFALIERSSGNTIDQAFPVEKLIGVPTLECEQKLR